MEFVGEEVVDTGELKREFFRLVAQAAAAVLLRGHEKAMTFRHNVKVLQVIYLQPIYD